MPDTLHELIAQIAQLSSQIPAMQKNAGRDLSAADRHVAKLYHEIEFSRFNAAHGYQMARRLQDALRRRRAVKRQQQCLHILQGMAERAARFVRSESDPVGEAEVAATLERI